MYEHHHEPLASTVTYLGRLARSMLFGLSVVSGALLLGVTGYHVFERLPWLDALLNAAMILGGMGPVDTLHSTAGKLFAAAYALFSGLVFIVAAGIMFSPVLHRFLHRFHLQKNQNNHNS